jgi:hypothetical protein
MWLLGHVWSTGLYDVANAWSDIYKILLSLFLLYNIPLNLSTLKNLTVKNNKGMLLYILWPKMSS